MTMNRQTVLSLALVGLAVAGLAITAFTGREPATRAAGADGHDHAAMAGGDEQQSVILDAAAARRIGVTYATAVMKPFERTVSAVGNVTYDETRLVNVNTKVEGWIEKLHVDFTGAAVRRGQPLLAVYSPMLVSAQEELILAQRLVDRADAGGGERAGANARDLVESARRRLRYWDVPASTLDQLERTGTPQKTVVLESPATGVVVEKLVVEGMRIMPGMDLYRIADLSRVWVEAEVFERDLSIVRLGQPATVTFEAYPGEEFSGAVAFINPVFSQESRTARVRVELANPALRLMPGMYGRVDLSSSGGAPQLTIPRNAVHFTGERALVFVRSPDGALVPRTITTGAMSATDVVVIAGLDEGDMIVSSANFLIDAESRLGTQRSVQSPAAPEAAGRNGGSSHTGH